MKTSKKVIILSVSTILSAGVLASSLALFTKLDTDGNISIHGNGAVAKEDDAYTITEKSISSEKVNPTTKAINTYTLGIDRKGGYTQSTIVADINFSLSIAGFTTVENYNDYLADYTVGIDLKGYANTSWYLDTKPGEGAAENSGVKHFDITGGTYEAGAYKVTLPNVMYFDTQELDVVFGMKEGAGIAEMKKHKDVASTINYTVELAKPANYNYSYLTGKFNGQISPKLTTVADLDTLDSKFALAPNLGAKEEEYFYEKLALVAKDEVRIVANESEQLVYHGKNDTDAAYVVNDVTETATVNVYYKPTKQTEKIYITTPEIFEEPKPTPVLSTIYVDWAATANTMNYSNAYLFKQLEKDKVENHTWSGLPMTKVEGYNTLYSYDVDLSLYEFVIFNCGKDTSIKTIDVPVSGYKAETPVFQVSTEQEKGAFKGAWVALDTIQKAQ